VTGANLSLSPDAEYSDNINVGTATASYTYPGDANHTGSTGSDTFEITPASSSVTVICPVTAQTYTGSPIEPCTASYSTEDGLSGSLTVSYTDNTNVGTATANATYAGDSNHTGSTGSDTFEITPASSSVTVTCSTSEVYTGSPIEPCTASYSTEDGLSGSLTVNYTDNTNVGTATANATYAGDANHTGSTGSDTFEISQAASTTVVTVSNATYDGNSHGGTAVVTGAGSLNQSLPVTYTGRNATTYGPSATAPTNAGDYTASATFSGDANHTGSSDSKNFAISKASSATVVTFEVGPYVYRGTAFTATAVVTGAGGLNQPVTIVYSGDCTNVTSANGCTATATFAGDPNHNGSNDSKSITIIKANQTITFAGLANKILGNPDFNVSASANSGLTVSLTASPASVCTISGSTVHLTGVGTCTVTASQAGNSNYNAATPVSHSFTVSYMSAGMCLGSANHAILQPINVDGTSVSKQGSTVPAKFRVCDANGNSIGTPGVVASFRLVATITGTTVETVNEVVDSTTPDTAFRWDATDKQWIYNINTKSLVKNKTYVYLITLNDGSTIQFQFGLK
jgi:hypothetical protein